jgi:hypothetical protein
MEVSFVVSGFSSSLSNREHDEARTIRQITQTYDRLSFSFMTVDFW